MSTSGFEKPVTAGAVALFAEHFPVPVGDYPPAAMDRAGWSVKVDTGLYSDSNDACRISHRRGLVARE